MVRAAARWAGVSSSCCTRVRVGERMIEHARQVLERQHVAHVVVDRGQADLAAAHQARPEGRVGGVLAGDLDAHLDVHSRGQREPRGVSAVRGETEVDEFLDRLVVAHHRATESPLLAQDRAQQVRVRAGRHPIERVERAHHGRRTRIHGRLVGRQVVVAQLLLRHVDRVVLTASHGRAVPGEVLHGRGHLVQRAEVAALVAPDLRRGDRRTQERVLPRSLDHAPPARVPADVDHRVEGPLDPVRGGLIGRDRLIVLTAAGSQELASPIGTGKIVLYPWMTSREKMTGMCSRDCRAACCTWLMLATPTRSSTEPTWPLRTSSSSVCPGVPFAPVGPDISSCPNFSASVIFPIRAFTFPEIARAAAAPRRALPRWPVSPDSPRPPAPLPGARPRPAEPPANQCVREPAAVMSTPSCPSSPPRETGRLRLRPQPDSRLLKRS